MKQEIRQNRVTILESEDSCSIPMIFNNLTGKNHATDEEYRIYIRYTAIPMMGFNYGRIEQIKDGRVVRTGQISRYRTKG